MGAAVTSESRLLHDVLRTFGRGKNFRIARNNTGVAKYCSTCESVHKAEHHPSYRVVTYGVPGAPDILGVIGPYGRAFGLETKTESGRMKPEQTAYHTMLRRFGGNVQVVRSMAEAVQWMKEIGAVWT